MKDNDNLTITFYDYYAASYAASTLKVDFSFIQNHFLRNLPYNAYILDFGCGSGRDTKFFLEAGIRVDALDGSEELCKLASTYTGIEVKHAFFQDLSEYEKYDGIWACASILHLNKVELRSVLEKMATALKTKGIIYTSFKYGDFEGFVGNRYFTYFTLEGFRDFIHDMEHLELEEYWMTGDVLPGRENEKWLNLILRKK